jgi:lysozyme
MGEAGVHGTTYTDLNFLTNYAAIKKAGMKAGAYFFFEPAQNPTQQANLLVSQLSKAGFASGDLVPMFDLETTGGMISSEIAASLQIAVDVVKNSLSVTPGIGSGSTFLAMPGGSTVFASSPLWIAYWSTNCPTVPLPWTHWTFWSYTDLGVVSGINGNVDLGRSNGANLPVFTGTILRLYLPLISRN